MIKDKDKSRIQSCVDHINTAVDVDPWAKELVAEMGKEILKAQLSKEDATPDCISRQAAIDAVNNIMPTKEGFYEPSEVLCELMQLPSAEPEIIHCRDCKHHSHDAGYGRDWCNRMSGVFRVKPDDYCSFAKRRTNGVQNE